MRVTSGDYMATEILDAAYAAQAELAALMKELLDRQVTVSAPDTSAGTYTIPYPELINVIERNIDRLTAGGMLPSGMGATVEWLGELNDARRFSYLDVNRWFESVELLTAVTHSVKKWTPVTGTFYSGDSRMRQILRSAVTTGTLFITAEGETLLTSAGEAFNVRRE